MHGFQRSTDLMQDLVFAEDDRIASRGHPDRMSHGVRAREHAPARRDDLSQSAELGTIGNRRVRLDPVARLKDEGASGEFAVETRRELHSIGRRNVSRVRQKRDDGAPQDRAHA